LLWALKEAAVKALGVGFHLLDPLAVEALSPRPWQGWVRVLVTAGPILPAWARPEGTRLAGQSLGIIEGKKSPRPSQFPTFQTHILLIIFPIIILTIRKWSFP